MQPTYVQISERVYTLWEKRGRLDENMDRLWFEAEQQLRQEMDFAPASMNPSRTNRGTPGSSAKANRKKSKSRPRESAHAF
jgi:hypothetical protein